MNALESQRSAGRGMTDDARALFELGAAKIESGDFSDALAPLRRAAELAPDHAQIRSLLGVAVAHAEHDFENARTLCESAAKQEFFNPDLYLNLSRVFLRFGRRAEALRYLRRGQMIDPGHAPILQAIQSLGDRKAPIVPFLPRRHLVNRALGSARNMVMNGLALR